MKNGPSALPEVHVCLVSAQATPNITPALDPEFRPGEVVLVVSPDMRQQAGWLAEVLSVAGVKVSEWPVADPWDIEHVTNRIWALLEAREGDDLALNATGGTKPMSIAAYQAFREMERPVFYVHPELDRVMWLYPSGRGSRDLADRVRLRAFFQAYGARLVGTRDGQGVAEPLRALTADLIEGVGALTRPMATLNYLAAEAREGLESPPLDERQGTDPDLASLVERFERVGLLEPRAGRLRFPSEDARFFVNGGWLEEHVYALLFNLRRDLPEIQDLERSVSLVRDAGSGRVANELDVAFLAANRLHIIECKTRRWVAGPGERAPADDVLYRLDTLGDVLGGLQARAMLVSYWEVRPADRQRAKDLGIRICCAGQLPRLREHLAEWIRGRPG
jgi:hypothetical protein